MYIYIYVINLYIYIRHTHKYCVLWQVFSRSVSICFLGLVPLQELAAFQLRLSGTFAREEQVVKLLSNAQVNRFCYPRCSMYGLFTYIWLIFMVNVGKYTIH